jgi:hypothetical protein
MTDDARHDPLRLLNRHVIVAMFVAVALCAAIASWHVQRMEAMQRAEAARQHRDQKRRLLEGLTHDWHRSLETTSQWINLCIQINQAQIEENHPGLPASDRAPLPAIIAGYDKRLTELEAERRGLTTPVGLLTQVEITFDEPATRAAAAALKARWIDAIDRFTYAAEHPVFPEMMKPPEHDNAWDLAKRREVEADRARRELDDLFRKLMRAIGKELNADY